MSSSEHPPGKAFYGVQLREFRNLQEASARLAPITVFVGRNSAGKTNLITGIAALDPTLFLPLLMRGLLRTRDFAPLTPLPGEFLGASREGEYGTAIGVRTSQGGAVVLELQEHSGGLSATWSKDGEVVARFQVAEGLSSYAIQYGDKITKFDRRRHKQQDVSEARVELSALRNLLLGPLRVSLHGEWDLSGDAIGRLERSLAANDGAIKPDVFLEQVATFFELPPLRFLPMYGVPFAILPTASEARRNELRNTRLRIARSAIESTLRETKSVGKELLDYIDTLLPSPFRDGSRELLAGAIRQRRTRLSATRLGAGYRSLLLICHKILTSDVCLIDEPEAFLHPGQQERLVAFLIEHSDRCQTIMTTHSNVMVNALFERGAPLLEIKDQPSGSTGNVKAIRRSDLAPLLDGFGVRASQLLQTNTVIWTEGPTDAMYLRRWIEIWSDGRLVYGRDFVTFPYGGSQLSHFANNAMAAYTAAESVRRIARHSIYVMDSDKARHGSRIDDKKLELQKKAEADGDLAWITTGREVENYIPLRILRAWGYTGTERGLLYADVPRLIAELDPQLPWKKNKPIIAQRVVPQIDLEGIVYTFDLGSHIDRICAKLREWSASG